MKKMRRIPGFRSEREEARFWDSHELADYLGDTEAVDEVIRLAPALAQKIRERSRKRLLTLRLEAWRIDGAKRLARRQGIPYQRLLRQWIADGLKRASG